MDSNPADLGETIGWAAVTVLREPTPDAKVRMTAAIAAAWRAGGLRLGPFPLPPARPARPPLPVLARPGEVHRRRLGGLKGRIALLHALAHIELNAIDLAWDIIARFGGGQPIKFIDDWIGVAAEEATHYALLTARLTELGAAYGDLPAHDGLWDAAQATAHDLLARLAIVPLVLEARGLDVTPAMETALLRAQDQRSAEIIHLILTDEIGHVAIGRWWFGRLCDDRRIEPVSTWQSLVGTYFKGRIKPPFNEAARQAAGFGAEFYTPLGQAWTGADQPMRGSPTAHG